MKHAFFPRIKIFFANFCASLSHAKEKNFDVLSLAEAKRKLILGEARQVLDAQLEHSKALFAEKIKHKKAHIQEVQDAIALKQSKLDEWQKTLQQKESLIAKISHDISKNEKTCAIQFENLKTVHSEYTDKLAFQSGADKSEILHGIKSTLIKSSLADLGRLSIEKQEQLKLDAQKIAQNAMQAVYYRYQPRFIWPKTSFTVEFTNQNMVSKYFEEESPFLKALLENSESSLNVLNTTANQISTIKIIGGLGVDKEIIRLTLEECRVKKIMNAEKIAAIRQKHKAVIEDQILHMGHEAIKLLHLQKMHPEILKLIGSLNFRTSHRQNQYFHSLEVATLAGMIANELGVDPSSAKRAGILHDIGKVLDYKLEGGHAVISAEYAARYYENDHVVDTILAHHDDKIVETPHAFILKAADAMSGARPGARVDAEDGYNRRLDGISAVVQSFKDMGVTHSAIMHAGREVHVYVDTKKTPHNQIDSLAKDIAAKLENDVEYPGQIRVTVIRRMEVTAVA